MLKGLADYSPTAERAEYRKLRQNARKEEKEKRDSWDATELEMASERERGHKNVGDVQEKGRAREKRVAGWGQGERLEVIKKDLNPSNLVASMECVS